LQLLLFRRITNLDRQETDNERIQLVNMTHDRDFHRTLHIRNAADRDDALQDAYVKLLRSHKPITPQLLRKTTVNCHKDRVKADRRRRRRELKSARFHGPLENGTDAESIVRQQPLGSESKRLSYSADPTAKMEQRETRPGIKRAVRAAQLSQDHRCALWAWMRDRVGDFAGRRKVPQVTVRVWAKRARDLKREGLGPD
jgi:DNA-directed RNA polymerase specialized sigma24 family protein